MILYLLIFLLILYFVLSYFKKEGYDNKNNEFKTYINENIPNEYYTKLYDNLIHTLPYEKEVIQIMYHYFLPNPTVLSAQCQIVGVQYFGEDPWFPAPLNSSSLLYD